MRWILLSLLGLAACADAAAPVPVTGKGPVTREDLVGRHLVRATGARDAKFVWDFTATDFSIARDGAEPIPAEILDAVAHTQGDVAKIEGEWELKGSSALVLTRLDVARNDGADHKAPDVTLAPFRTPVVRFEIGGTQWVLGPR